MLLSVINLPASNLTSLGAFELVQRYSGKYEILFRVGVGRTGAKNWESSNGTETKSFGVFGCKPTATASGCDVNAGFVPQASFRAAQL